MDDEGGIKIVVVGDGAIGKTSLLISYQSNEFPETHVPTIFENTTIAKTIELHGEESTITLDLWDTAGQQQFDRLRILAYRATDVFLLCFSVVALSSFQNLEQKWLPEIKHHCDEALILLVGTKCDLKDDSHEIIPKDQILKYKEQIQACAYVETSAKQRLNVDYCFQTAIQKFLDSGERQKNGSTCCVLL
eukprot:422047_1